MLGRRGSRAHQHLNLVVLAPQGCYDKVKIWFDDNKHVLGTVGMCILVMQVRGLPELPVPLLAPGQRRKPNPGT